MKSLKVSIVDQEIVKNFVKKVINVIENKNRIKGIIILDMKNFEFNFSLHYINNIFKQAKTNK